MRNILLVDLHDEPRELCVRALEDHFVVAYAEGVADALAALLDRGIALIVTDCTLGPERCHAVCEAVRHSALVRYVPIVAISHAREHDAAAAAATLEAGADVVLPPPISEPMLRAQVRALLRARPAPASSVTLEDMVKRKRDELASAASLSAREREVLDLLLLGRSLDEIALVLGITPRTVKFHQANILEKLGADSRLDLVRLFIQ